VATAVRDFYNRLQTLNQEMQEQTMANFQNFVKPSNNVSLNRSLRESMAKDTIQERNP